MISYSTQATALLGIAIVLAAVILIGIQDFFWKVLVKETHPLTINFYRTASIAAAALAYSAFKGTFELIPAEHSLFLVLGVLFSPVLGVGFFIAAMSKLEVSKVVTIRTLEPFIVIVYALIAFGTMPGARELIGGTLIVAGVALAVLFHKFKNKIYKTRSPPAAA